MIIGTLNGREVYWNERDKVIKIQGTEITITGAASKDVAIGLCKKNLRNFYEIRTLYAEWDADKHMFRLYKREYPKRTVMYVDDFDEAQELISNTEFVLCSSDELPVV